MKIITWNLADIWHITFSSDPPDILLCEGTGIGYKSIVKLKFCAKPMHQIYVINIVSFLKLVYQNKNELLGTSMAFTMIVSRFGKSHCPLKFSAPLPWQPNIIKTLATGAISKLMIQTIELTTTYTLLNPVTLLWIWHFKHGVYATRFPFSWLIINSVYNLWKMVRLKYNIMTWQYIVKWKLSI